MVMNEIKDSEEPSIVKSIACSLPTANKLELHKTDKLHSASRVHQLYSLFNTAHRNWLTQGQINQQYSHIHFNCSVKQGTSSDRMRCAS